MDAGLVQGLEFQEAPKIITGEFKQCLQGLIKVPLQQQGTIYDFCPAQRVR